MKRYYILPLLLAAFLVASCAKNKKKENANEPQSKRENPLLHKSDLPYGVPDFSKIQNRDYKPAIETGIKAEKKEIDSIANNPDAPTFENTLVALEKTGQQLGRALGPFYLLTSADRNDTLQKVQEEMAPKLAGLSDYLFLNDKLFQRVKAVHDQVDSLDLDHESKRLVHYYYNKFVLRGAKLSEAKKDSLKSINKKLAGLGSKFGKKVLASFKASALIVDDSAKLKGLSHGQIESAADYAKAHKHKGEYEIPLVNTTQQPALTNLENRKVRHQLYEDSYNRTEKGDAQDTRKIVLKMAHLRAVKAKLLGYDNYASWNLVDQMAKTPENVEELLNKIVPAATRKAKAEAGDLQEVIDKSGENFKLEPWDWNFYANKLRKAKYDIDQDEVKQYFVLDSVLKNGVFYAANQLYGLTFTERHDIPVYNDDVRVFNVIDKDGSQIGLFYCDYFKRDSKQGGAWMNNLIGQSYLLDKKPVIYNVCNFHKPVEGEPALLTFDNVTTMFHEFGHALHGFFASQKYPSLSGTNVARDFVEFPSQFNEHWALYPKVLKHYARNYRTGAVIPQELVDKIKKSATFNQGYLMTELLAAAQLDMQWHMISAKDKVTNVDTFELNALTRTHLHLNDVPPRYRSSYFSHIWSGGYSAGYYAYIWTEMLDDDAYSWFEENGGMTRANGQRFRDMILSKGHTEDYTKMFKDFRGRKPSIQPLLKDKGLTD